MVWIVVQLQAVFISICICTVIHWSQNKYHTADGQVRSGARRVLAPCGVLNLQVSSCRKIVSMKEEEKLRVKPFSHPVDQFL